MNAGVRILAASNTRQWLPEVWNRLCGMLPAQFCASALSHVSWQDRQATVLGRLLLQHGLVELGYDGMLVRSIRLDAFKRPYVSDALDFNISHTEGLVVCALSEGSRVGIDVEALRPLEAFDHSLVFTHNECCLMEKTAEAGSLFFSFWTRKEALIKADGRGFFLDPLTVEVITDSILVGPRRWYIQKVPLGEGFVCHLASDRLGDFCVKMLTKDNLMD
jgi:4'-phosphopantetheinyl transferase